MKNQLPKTFKKSSSYGFTLIELMVVIAIIAILAAVGLTIFSGQQKAARDAKRRTDIDAIASAMEAAYTTGSATPYGTIYGTSFAGGALPTDPNSPTTIYTLGGSAIATPTAPAASWTLCAPLENANGNASTTAGVAASGSSATFYCRKNQQS